jgi:ribose transport system substrate-binding protein
MRTFMKDWRPAGALVMAGVGPARRPRKGTIYYLAPTLFDEFQVETKDMVELLFGQLGYKVVTLDAQQRADLQNSQMDDAVLQGPKAIILAAVDFDAISPGIERRTPPAFPSWSMTQQIRNWPVEFTSVAGTVEIGLSAAEAVKLLTANMASPRARCCRSWATPATPTRSTSSKASRRSWQRPRTSGHRQALEGLGADQRRQHVQDQPRQSRHRHAVHPCRSPDAADRLRARERRQEEGRHHDRRRHRHAGRPASLAREGWVQTIVEQPLCGQVYGMAMFLDHVINKKADQGRHMMSWAALGDHDRNLGPNPRVPGGVITKDNVDDSKFWGNLKPPGVPVPKVE